MEQLNKTLPIGVLKDDIVIKEYSLLRSNGIAEKVFTEKNQSKPYTWMGYVLTIAIDKIGTIPVGGAARQEYSRTSGSITIPQIVLDIPLNDVNTLLIEIHRTVWKNLMRNQETICKYCGNKSIIDIDLDRIKMLPEDLIKLEGEGYSHTIPIDLIDGWLFEPPLTVGSSQTSPYLDYKDILFNRFIFRMPTLGDAIRHEKLSTDTITFWRRIAFDCLQQIVAFDKNTGSHITELPVDIKRIYSTKIFDEILFASDLEQIRTTLREGPPTLPFYYIEECSNPLCKSDAPVSIEASSFFSD